MAYVNVTISGYNANPPADDGSAVAANEIAWSKHKTKLGDPLKTAIESMDTNIGTAITAAEARMPTGTVFPYAGSSVPSGFLDCNGAAVSRTTYAALFTVISTTYGVGDGSTTFNVPNATGRVIAGKEPTASLLTSGAGGVDGATLGATGGSQTHALTLAEGPAHTHTGPSHNHTITHTHTGPSHSHTIAHTHTFSDTSTGAGSHEHTYLKPVLGGSFGSSPTAVMLTTSPTATTGGPGNHTHNVSGTTSASSAANSGNSGTGTTSASSSANTGSAGTGATGSTGSGTAHKNVQPTIILLYIIKT